MMEGMSRHDRAAKPPGGRQPGHAYMRNFNKSPRGKMHVRMGRAKPSRAKSARG
jgi:hypothetical protein